VLLRCGKPSVAKKSSVNINVAEDTVTSMYIYSQICYLFHWTTSFVVYLVCCVTALYTKVVRFSFNQRKKIFPWPGAPLFSGTGLWPGKRASAFGESSLACLQPLTFRHRVTRSCPKGCDLLPDRRLPIGQENSLCALRVSVVSK